MMAIAIAFWDAIRTFAVTALVSVCVAYLAAPAFLGVTVISKTALVIAGLLSMITSSISFFSSYGEARHVLG